MLRFKGLLRVSCSEVNPASFESLKAELLMILDLWNIQPCHLVKSCGCFEGSYRCLLREQVFHEAADCRNPHNSSNRFSRCTKELGYKHTFCLNAVHAKISFLLIFLPKHNLLKFWSFENLSSFFCLL